MFCAMFTWIFIRHILLPKRCFNSVRKISCDHEQLVVVNNKKHLSLQIMKTLRVQKNRIYVTGAVLGI